MSAHTPGPLKERPRYTSRSPRVEQIDLVDGDGERVATILADDTEQVENCTILEVVSKRSKANAAELVRRWNAHEDLLAALVACRKQMQNDWHNKPRIGMEAECAMADAAISKARGA